MLTYASLGLPSEEIHSVERPLTVLLSLTLLSSSDRVDDRRACAWSSEAGTRCGTLGGTTENAGIWVCGTRGDDGILRESPQLRSDPESTVTAIELVMVLRWSVVELELRRPLSLPEVLA